MRNPGIYLQEKEKAADILINIMEKYVIPDLRKHIVVRILHPATYVRFSGSPTGSIYDMAAVPTTSARIDCRFYAGNGLLAPKFAHGVFGAMNSGLQAVDILLDGKVMHGKFQVQANSGEIIRIIKNKWFSHLYNQRLMMYPSF